MQPGKLSWLILGGCPRSGTTMLMFILNTHPHIRITAEISLERLWPKIMDLFYKEKQFYEIPDRLMSRKETWARSDIHPLLFQADRCALAVLQTLYKSQFKDQTDVEKIRYFGDKFPGYYHGNLNDLRERLGGLKVIHISRNPLDVVNSMLWRAENARQGLDYWRFALTPEKACHEWASSWNFIAERVRNHDKNFLHIKYENLITNTRDELMRLSNFLGVEPNFRDEVIIKAFHHERDLLDEAALKTIKQDLCGIDEIWDLPLPEIVERLPRIPLKKIEKLSDSDPRLLRQTVHKKLSLQMLWGRFRAMF